MIQNQAGAVFLGRKCRATPGYPKPQKSSYILLFRVHPPWPPDYVVLL